MNVSEPYRTYAEITIRNGRPDLITVFDIHRGRLDKMRAFLQFLAPLNRNGI